MRASQLRHRRRLLVLGMAAFVSFIGASDPLNPLVMRSDGTRTPVPVECETGLSNAPALRLDVASIPMPEPEPAEAPPPPSGSLRAQLALVQDALVRNDRTAFDAAFARAKALTEAHPAGGERRAAEELVRIYEGARRLWDAQYQSPFFGDDSTEYAIVSVHPGYAEVMRRQTLTDARGTRFYPAAESRAFLTGIAADRLKALGVRAPARATQTGRTGTTGRTPSRETRTDPTIVDDESRPLPAIRPRSTRPGTATSRNTTRTTPRSTGTSRPRKPVAVTSASSSPNPSASPTTTAVPKPAAPPVTGGSPATASSPAAGRPTPAAEPPVTDTEVADIPPPLDVPTGTSPVTGSGPAVDTAFTDTALTDTALTDTGLTSTAPATTIDTATPATGTAPDTRPLRSRSVVLPTILILIGLAVLIVLFRASK